jgi:hypothetical protein
VAFSPEVDAVLDQVPLRAFSGETEGVLDQLTVRWFSLENDAVLAQVPLRAFSMEVDNVFEQIPLRAFSLEVDNNFILFHISIGGESDESIAFRPFSFGGESDEPVSFLYTPLLRLDQVRAPLIAVRRGVNMNTTSDTPLLLGPKRFIIRRVIVTNASVSLTTAIGGIYTGAGKTGTALVPASQTYSALTAPSKYMDTGQHILTITDMFSNQTLFFSLTTPQGVAATADIYIYGDSVDS